jgi:protein-L-isoaspartate(D-aspartate) O-methyltransferase
MKQEKDGAFKLLREKMVKGQIKARGIHDERVLSAFRNVPRHRFVPLERVDSAYDDHPLPIGYGQTISQPYMVALMTDALKLTGAEKVLEIGTGSGYQAAILSELAGSVYSIESVPALYESASLLLNEMGHTNIKLKVGDGSLGWKEFSPYDGIVVTASAPSVPEPLVEQLADGGRMVVPVGDSYNQILTLVKKDKGKVHTEELCGCVFVPLIGEYGWKEERT